MTPPRIRRTDRFSDNERAARNKSRLMRARACAPARVLLHLTSPQNTALRFNSVLTSKRATLTRARCEIRLFRFPRRGHINRITYIVYRARGRAPLRDHRPFAIAAHSRRKRSSLVTWHRSELFVLYSCHVALENNYILAAAAATATAAACVRACQRATCRRRFTGIAIRSTIDIPARPPPSFLRSR